MMLLRYSLVSLAYASTVERLSRDYKSEYAVLYMHVYGLKSVTPKNKLSDGEVDELAMELVRDGLTPAVQDALEHLDGWDLQRTLQSGIRRIRERPASAAKERIAEIRESIEEARALLDAELAATFATKDAAVRLMSNIDRIEADLESYKNSLPAGGYAPSLPEERLDAFMVALDPVTHSEPSIDTFIVSLSALIRVPHARRSAVQQVATMFRTIYQPVVAQAVRDAQAADRSTRELDHATKDTIVAWELEIEELEKFHKSLSRPL